MKKCYCYSSLEFRPLKTVSDLALTFLASFDAYCHSLCARFYISLVLLKNCLDFFSTTMSALTTGVITKEKLRFYHVQMPLSVLLP